MVHIRLVLFVNTILVHHTWFCIFDITFPEIAVVNFVHRQFLPVVKFSDERDS